MNFYDLAAKDRSGNEVSMSNYKGKVVLVINSATQCGFTPQYEGLQKLYDKYKDEDFVILEFPCNQFKNQAPESDEEIKTFCESKYGVTFPGFAKIEVNGNNAHPIFKYLKSQRGFQGFDMKHPIAPKLVEILSASVPDYESTPDIKWNFTKFLIDREGNVVERFEPTTDLSVVEEKIKEVL